jgi:hypothetical protein
MLIFPAGLVKSFHTPIRGERPYSLPGKPRQQLASFAACSHLLGWREKEPAAVSSENPVGGSEEGKSCSHFVLLQFLHP